MREIKFRVWDNLKKEWLKKKVYHSSISLNERGIGEFVFKQHPEGYIIQQYTGLKDKNNVEIYEGDILERKNAGYLYAAEYSKTEAAYVLRDRDGDDSVYLPDFIHNLEVVGNIFKTPELLK